MEGDVEEKLKALLAEQKFDRAATLAIQVYGPELYGFLVHYMGSQSDAEEVFSQALEDIWRGLPTFRGQCSVRTWMYLLARNAAARFRRSPWRRKRKGGESQLDALAAEVRTRTEPWLRTEVKDRWRTLRDSLEPDDRALLNLRVDRKLSWLDVARVLLGEEDPGQQALEKEAARLRKRFQVLKEELHKRAAAAGLIEA